MILRMRFQRFNSFLAIICFLLVQKEAFSQKNFQRTLLWEQTTIANADQITSKKIESFTGAAFDFHFKDLSFYTEKFKGGFQSFSISQTKYEPLTIELSEEQKSIIKNQVEISFQNVFERKEIYTQIKVLPYRKNTSGQIEKLVSFVINAIPSSNTLATKTNASRNYASNSVLKDGNWYKMGISSTGIHKITFDDLVKMGIDASQVNPKNIRVYGNAGGILPEANYLARYDDLQENAIIVVGENDNVFDKGDYILFYASGPNVMYYDITNKLILNSNNTYSTESYYFINVDKGAGKRMVTQSSETNPNLVVNEYNYFDIHEQNNSTGLNLTIKSGRERFGEEFNNQTTYDFNFTIPDIISSKPLKLRVDLLGRVKEPSSSTFTIKQNGSTISNLVCPGVGFDYNYAYGNLASTGYLPIAASENINLNITYNRPDITAIGYLNFIWINAYRQLKMISNQFGFRNLDAIGAGKIAQYNLTAENPSNITILDVSDKINPKIQQSTINANTISFAVSNDALREFQAFSGSNFSSPRLIGKIANQNLHALGQYDFVIVTHPDFKNEAERLAEFRRTNNNLRTLVVVPSDIYNEFSSGAQDASAIRDFMKMFYDRAGNNVSEMPKYLLIFGDGSYDNAGVLKANSNYVVTFESRNSITPFGSYVSDDYFGLLDDIEGDWDSNSGADYGTVALDVAVGRLPIQSALQAREMVDKIISYSNTATFGDWRNKYVLIADDQDDNTHLIHAEGHAALIKSKNKDFNIDKIYLDSYQQMSTPMGNRYPEINSAFNQRVNSGSLVINYVGHGGENGLAHEKILTIDDINGWKGLNNMPVLVTATCSFSRWDDPAFQSAGELALLNPNGGAIALYTTTRIVYAHENRAINEAFIRSLFDSTNVGGTNTLGDIFRKSKNYNGLGLSINQRNFTLLGDPSLPFATPKYKVITDSINSIAAGDQNSDTIKALSTIVIKGYIADKNGNLLSNYNGVVYPAVYDKKTTQKTLGQDKGNAGSLVASYVVQKNVIYKGKASVTNGRFTFSFVVPKDISYNVGYGRLSYYAQLGNVDANGSYDSILVGGSSNSIINDTQGPEMKVFLNNDQFANGGITGESPLLIVQLKDLNGVNTVGNGIGHNLTASLTNGTESQKIDLNEYYESKLDNYQEGEIKYPLTKLSAGNYKLTLKAWDVVNNSSEKSIEFTVLESKDFSIDKIYNYPNPFTTSTGFQFEHNRPGDNLNVMIQIFSVSGRLVKTISYDVLNSGSRVADIKWDGKDDFGDKLARGVYVYRLKVKASDGSLKDGYQKLVILN